jgi:hypothetical protein
MTAIPQQGPPLHGLLYRFGKFAAQVIATELAAAATWVAVDVWRHRKDFGT